MRWSHVALCAFAVLVAARVVAADGDPPAPPASPDEPAWKREANDLEKRAAEAEGKQDLETALALRRKALALARENLKGDSLGVAERVNNLAYVLEALGRPSSIGRRIGG